MPQMPHDELRNSVHAIVARLQSEFEAELGRLEERHEFQVQRARDETREEVRSQLETKAAEELASKLSAARTEAERASTESTERLRKELEQASAEAIARARQQAEEAAREEARTERARLEAEHASERERLSSSIEAERVTSRALTAELDQVRATLADLDRARSTIARLEAAQESLTCELEAARTAVTTAQQTQRENEQAIAGLQAAQQTLAQERDVAAHALATAQGTQRQNEEAIARLQAAQQSLRQERDAAWDALSVQDQRRSQNEEAITSARAVERQAQLSFVERLLSAVRTISAARSLSDTLTALTTAAATLAPRAALFVVSGKEVQGWRAAGFDAASPASLRLRNDQGGLMATATASGAVVSTATIPAPAFASLAADRAGLAVPITVGSQSVAVLYADDGVAGESEAPASWPEAMQILGAHASACLARITALRTTQAMQAGAGAIPRSASASSEEDNSARRYARLLVSEIKLYNEGAVRVGREKRDLLIRLRAEIERARRLYEERVSPSVAARSVYFQEELVHTLADGDSALLGSA
jgi:hypothetical protein